MLTEEHDLFILIGLFSAQSALNRGGHDVALFRDPQLYLTLSRFTVLINSKTDLRLVVQWTLSSLAEFVSSCFVLTALDAAGILAEVIQDVTCS